MNHQNPSAYRSCIGIMLLNKEGKVFTGQRIDTSIGAWQMPQGGIDEGEDITRAAFRELEEETGISEYMVEVISQTQDWVYYDLPYHLLGKIWGGKYKGQKQIWVLMRFLGEDSNINLKAHAPEFNEWKWVNPSDLPDMIVPFKKTVYKEVLRVFKNYIL